MSWDKEIQELEQFFEKRDLPKELVPLNECATIYDAKLFVKNELSAIKNHNGNEYFRSALDRLIKFKKIIESNGL